MHAFQYGHLTSPAAAELPVRAASQSCQSELPVRPTRQYMRNMTTPHCWRPADQIMFMNVVLSHKLPSCTAEVHFESNMLLDRHRQCSLQPCKTLGFRYSWQHRHAQQDAPLYLSSSSTMTDHCRVELQQPILMKACTSLLRYRNPDISMENPIHSWKSVSHLPLCFLP